ncbi:hypothetical protein FB446DRAFT_773262, partial [Lentinula raphanica]
MPRGPRSHSTPPSSSASSSTFGRGKATTLDSLCSASANSMPPLSSADNRRLERVQEEDSDTDNPSHPPSSASPSGTTAPSPDPSATSSQDDTSGLTTDIADKEALCPPKVLSSVNKDAAADPTPAQGSKNPLYAVLRANLDADEPSVRSPGDDVQSSRPPVAATPSSLAGGGDTGDPHLSEPPAHGQSPSEPSAWDPLPCRQRVAHRESSGRGRYIRKNTPDQEHLKDPRDFPKFLESLKQLAAP